MPGSKDGNHDPSRRTFLKQMRWAPVLFVPAPICNPLFWAPGLHRLSTAQTPFPFSDMAFEPHYPAKSPLDEILRIAAPGGDEFTFEGYAVEIALCWGSGARTSSAAAGNRSFEQVCRSRDSIDFVYSNS